MGDLERRLRDLEARESRTPPTTGARPGSGLLAEIRSLEAQIRRLETGAGEARTAPETAVVKSVAPDAELAAVVRKIEWLERQDHAPEGGKRWT